MANKRAVRSATTSTSPETSVAELSKLLQRYGAAGLSIARDWKNATITVQFVMRDSPNTDAREIPVALPVDIRRVYDRLYERPFKNHWFTDEERKERARRGLPALYSE